MNPTDVKSARPAPSAKSLAQRLLIKPTMRVLALNLPQEVAAQLDPLPEGATLQLNIAPDVGENPYDVVIVFLRDRAAIEREAPRAMAAVCTGGLLWMAYPKKTGAIKTDIHRDVGWDVVTAAGWQGVAQISVDETWSALRFRPASETNRRDAPGNRFNTAEGSANEGAE